MSFKKKHYCFIWISVITILLLAALVVFVYSIFSEASIIPNELTKEGVILSLENMLDRAQISVKIINENTEYYNMIVTHEITDIMYNSKWDVYMEAKMDTPYVVLRLAEGYEVAFDEYGNIGVYYKYSSGVTHCQYKSDIDIDKLIEEIQADSSVCNFSDIVGAFLYY